MNILGNLGNNMNIQRKRARRGFSLAKSPLPKDRVEEDDPLVYRDGPLEAVSSKFETAKPYFNTRMFIDLNKIDDMGFPHLRVYL